MGFPHQHQSTVRNGLLAALPPEDLARLRPSLQTVNSPSTRRLFPRTAPSRRCYFPRAAWCPAGHAGRRGAGRGGIDQLLDAVMAHPILINRPIVVTPLGVRLCRPSEAVLDILPDP